MPVTLDLTGIKLLKKGDIIFQDADCMFEIVKIDETHVTLIASSGTASNLKVMALSTLLLEQWQLHTDK